MAAAFVSQPDQMYSLKQEHEQGSLPEDAASPPSARVQLSSTSSSSSSSDDDQHVQEEAALGKQIANRIQELDCEELELRSADPKSIQDYLSVLAILSGLPAAVALDVLSNLISMPRNRRPFRDTILDSVMGHCYRLSTLRQLRILTGVRPLKKELSGWYYRWSGASRKLSNFNSELEKPNGDFVARWVHEHPNRTPQDPVLLYFHGGGYALKTCQPQVSYICSLAKILRKHRVSVVVLDYTITPFACFPTQRNQALACLKALEKTCSNILLIGDSCGGNLALSALLEEKGPLAVDHSKIKGCVLVSPWVDPADQEGSMNSKRDILTRRRLNDMTKSFVPDEELKNPQVAPIRADKATWQRVLPKRTAIVWGSLECLADQDKRFMELAGIKEYFIERNGTHDCILRGLAPEPCKYITRLLLEWTRDTPHNREQLAQAKEDSKDINSPNNSANSTAATTPSMSTTTLVTTASESTKGSIKTK